MTEPNAVAVQQNATPADLLRVAVSTGADLDKLERLMQMQERWEANEARKEFTRAMTAFKSEPLTVFKRQTVDFTSAKGRTHYKHANLADVTAVVGPAMSKHGLSYRWDVRQEAKSVTVACIVTHERGHSERVEMSGPLDDTGNKNPIQQAGSTVQYLQRYTLLACSGLSTQNEHDDDGRSGAGGDEDDPLLVEWQSASLEGDDALRAAYFKAEDDPILWKEKGSRLWAKHGASLKDAAKKADKDGEAGEP